MLKKIISILVSLSLTIGGAATIASATDNTFPTWYVNANAGLNCRKTPTTNEDNILTTFEKGTQLQIIGTDPSGKWWEVWDGTTQGYCYASYLVKTEEELTSTPEVSGNLEYIGDFKCTVYNTSVGENGGYTTTAWGRRRYLQHIQDEPYEFTYNEHRQVDFNPLFTSTCDISNDVPQDVKDEYIAQLQKANSYRRNKILEEAKNNGIDIKNNQSFIAEALRQCLNSVIQGRQHCPYTLNPITQGCANQTDQC